MPFDSKNFNAEVFGAYVDRVPNLRLTRLLESGAIRPRQDLAASMRDEVGGNYISTPLLGLIDGAPMNYDGVTDITTRSTTTYMHSRVVVGRAQSWEERDFSYDITGGVDFMENVAQQLAGYWAGVDQDTIVAILKGVFSMTGTENLKFVNQHTLDIRAVQSYQLGYMDETTINTAVQKASGDNKGIFSLVICHSAVATHLENANATARVKVTENGVERDTGLRTLSGKMLLVDDSMPVEEVTVGEGAEATTQTVYTSYILGTGAIEYTNCGVKVPYEMSRDPAKYGGKDMLYTRQRKCWAPYGISFTKANMETSSPENDELSDGDNWELVKSGGSVTQYLDHRAIPIARVLSLG